MLICPAVQEDPTNKSIRAWIMVGFLNMERIVYLFLYMLIFKTILLIQIPSICE